MPPDCRKRNFSLISFSFIMVFDSTDAFSVGKQDNDSLWPNFNIFKPCKSFFRIKNRSSMKHSTWFYCTVKLRYTGYKWSCASTTCPRKQRTNRSSRGRSSLPGDKLDLQPDRKWLLKMQLSFNQFVVLCSWARQFISTVSLSTQVGQFNAGGDPAIDLHPVQGSSRFMLRKPG